MSLKRDLTLLAFLAFSNPAFAQQHPANRGAHPGGAAGHPGQQHVMPGGRQMTPQQREYQQHQQMLNEQMMFMEMMRSRGGAYRRQGTATPAGRGKQPSGNSRPQPNANRPQNGSNSAQPTNNKAKPSEKQPQTKRAESPGNVGKQTQQESEKAAKEKEATASKKRKEEENAIRRNGTKKELIANKRPQASDQMSIGLLKNAHSTMSRADHDYGGHRVRSMEYVTSALQHLGATSGVIGSASSSPGNLSQAQSDQLLRDAEFHLKNVVNTIGTGKNTLSYHHNARASVEAAIHELHVALSIK